MTFHRVEAIDLNRELATVIEGVRNYFDACHQWLSDPHNPGQYTLEPRSEDVMIVYEKREGDKTIREKARLSRLIRQVEDGLGVRVVSCSASHSDIRKLFLKSSGLLLKEIHRVGDKLGLFAQKGLEAEILESLRYGVAEVRREFEVRFNIKMSWEETIERIIKYYPKRRAYLEKLREEGVPDSDDL